MILQREKPVHVWGKADPESVIHVRIQGKETVTKADGSGIWKAVIEPLSSSFSETMEIISDAEKAVIDNVAVGAVWLAGSICPRQGG
ncbi:hypothetical protein ACTQ3A_06570 [Bilifractor sp. LCP21S3_F8]|uniref:hypothetical protein n=1 Tax=Bilifractor sp. LCP21S3_F8 TaxID=3438744 RepID=UPI003F904E78